MPFDRPTLSELRAAVKADIDSALPSANALLRFSNMGILGDVVAAGLAGEYGYLDWIARQSVPFTATDEFLEAWSAFKNIVRKPAALAIGSAVFTGTNSSVIPAGTPIARQDGVTYTTDADATVSGGSATVAITADVAGAAGNAADGTALTLDVSVSGVNSTGAASGPLTGGADVETDADLRSRMLEAFAKPPQGGDADDYVEWALSVPGVTRAWCAPLTAGVGTVGVYFMMDDAEAAFGGFPQGTDGVAADETRDTAATGDQLAVANAIFPLRPVTALVYALAPRPNTVDLTIAGISGASVALKGSIAAAFAAALLVDAKPGGVTNMSTIEGAIAGVAGSTGFVITVTACDHGTVSPGIDGNITSDTGYLAVPGTITYI